MTPTFWPSIGVGKPFPFHQFPVRHLSVHQISVNSREKPDPPAGQPPQDWWEAITFRKRYALGFLFVILLANMIQQVQGECHKAL